MNEVIFLPTILLVNLGDTASRDFIDSLTKEEYASFSEIVDVANPQHLSRLDYLINELSLPFVFSAYPSAWVLLNREYTFAKGDKIARIDNIVNNCDAWNIEVDRINDERILAGKSTYYQWVRNRAIEEMIGAIVEDRMMSHEYKIRYIRHQIVLCSEIPVQLAALLIACQRIEDINVLYYRFMEEGLLQKQKQLEIVVKEETKLSLGENVRLTIPAPKLPLPI